MSPGSKHYRTVFLAIYDCPWFNLWQVPANVKRAAGAPERLTLMEIFKVGYWDHTQDRDPIEYGVLALEGRSTDFDEESQGAVVGELKYMGEG